MPDSDLAPFVESGLLDATTDPSVMDHCDTVNICVPTPLRKTRDPDISYIVAAVEEIAMHLHPGMLVVLETTTYPGTTEEVILPMLERDDSGSGSDFYLAFSPERVDPGNPRVHHARTSPRSSGGVTPRCTEAGRPRSTPSARTRSCR